LLVKRDVYAEVSARIVAELERGAAPWIKPWSATAGQNVPQNAVTNRPYSGCNVILLWLARDRGWATPRFLTFKQALEAGGHVRKGEHGTKVYFVKQLRVQDGEGEEAESRLIPMMREYTVFNVDQCDGLSDSIHTGKPMRVPATRRLPHNAAGLVRQFYDFDFGATAQPGERAILMSSGGRQGDRPVGSPFRRRSHHSDPGRRASDAFRCRAGKARGCTSPTPTES
jgi:antirestriction protein ArdC